MATQTATLSEAIHAVAPNAPVLHSRHGLHLPPGWRTTDRASLSSTGQQAYQVADNFALSGNGLFVAFLSLDPNIVPGDSNGFTETDPNGTFQSLLLGAPRQFFLSARAKF